jgi:aromatic-L-amino-acid decarboxylase
MVLYTSEQSHSSIDKAAIALGLGLDNVRHVPTDDAFRMDVDALRQLIAEDRAAGLLPIAVVATAGTTSTTSVDPVRAIGELCRDEGLWLHVDAAWAGSAAVCPEYRQHLDGVELADSLVVNPHKWMFTPMDCSVLFVRDVDALRAAFSLVPEYLVTERHPAKVDLMDFGVQLGRRFRSLKLWMVIRSFGVEGLRRLVRAHCRMGQRFAEWVEQDPGFELSAPTPFGTVCFRAIDPRGELDDEALDELNERLLQAVNRRGPVFLSHTKLHGRYVLRLAVSNLRTTSEVVKQAWDFLREDAERLRAG